MSRFITYLKRQSKFDDSVGHLAREVVSDDNAQWVHDTPESWQEYLTKRQATESENRAFQQAWREWRGGVHV